MQMYLYTKRTHIYTYTYIFVYVTYILYFYIYEKTCLMLLYLRRVWIYYALFYLAIFHNLRAY